MAAPRPGWSRRAQYGLFFSFIAAIAAVAIGLILLAFSIAAPSRFNNLKGAALDATAPITTLLDQIGTTADGLASGAGAYWDAANQNERLRRQRDAMRQELTVAQAVLLENRQLKAALQLRERTPEAVAAGRLVGSSFQSPRRFAIFSAGSRDGVAVGMPVRAAEGLIGRVINTGSTASRVLLISDRSSIVPSRLLRTGQAVIAQGRGDGLLELKPIEVGQNPFKRGDLVITSGTGGLYPPLVPVARVLRTQGDNAIAKPLADPETVTVAIAQEPYEPAAMEVRPSMDDELL